MIDCYYWLSTGVIAGMVIAAIIVALATRK
jgi:hypothetical protein